MVKDTIDNSKKLLESVITFRQGRIGIDNSQLPNVERIATYLRNHKEAGVVIKGYASPEGSAEVTNASPANAPRPCAICWSIDIESPKTGLLPKVREWVICLKNRTGTG